MVDIPKGVIWESDTIATIERDHVDGNRGYCQRDWDEHPFAATEYTTAFPTSALIDESEWDDRYNEFLTQKNSLADQVKTTGWTVFDQGNTNYCWANAVVACLEAARIKQGDPWIRLSSASVAAIIKNFRNQGGWGSEALEFCVERGVATNATWGNAVINPGREAINQADIERPHFKAIEFYELPPDPVDMRKCFMSALFHGWPCAPGYDWWRHQVAAFAPWKSPNGVWGSTGPNSWAATYGDNGWYYLEGRKSVAQDCICLHSVTPSPGPGG